MAEHFDLMPNQVLRAAQFGQKEFILNSKTVWLCAACEACSTRCRQGIDITRVMDVLKIMAQREGIEPSVRTVPMFYKSGLRRIKLFGRVYELELMRNFIYGGFSPASWISGGSSLAICPWP